MVDSIHGGSEARSSGENIVGEVFFECKRTLIETLKERLWRKF